MQLVKKSFSYTLLAAILMVVSANAADAGAQDSVSHTQPPINLSEERVAQFAGAYLAVQSLNEKYAQHLKQVAKPEQKQALQDLAQSQMKAAISRSGLTLDEYKNIAAAANSNDVLRERIAAAVDVLVEPAATDG